MNLKNNVTQDDLKKVFNKYGELINLGLKSNKKYETNQGWVNFRHLKEAEEAKNDRSEAM